MEYRYSSICFELSYIRDAVAFGVELRAQPITADDTTGGDIRPPTSCRLAEITQLSHPTPSVNPDPWCRIREIIGLERWVEAGVTDVQAQYTMSLFPGIS